MPKLAPVSWQSFVRKMRSLGFDGPFQEGKHPYMTKGTTSVTIPNPHEGQISVDLLRRILNQAGIKRENWLK